MGEARDRHRVLMDYRDTTTSKRHQGRPSNAERAAEEAELHRIAVRAVLAKHGHLPPAEAAQALAEYEARSAYPLAGTAPLLPKTLPDCSDVEPSRVLRDDLP